MKNIKILSRIFKQTGTSKAILIYVIFVFIVAFLIQITEPGITKYGDALWLTDSLYGSITVLFN